MVTYTIEIAPKPTPRPRVGKNGAYYPAAYQQYKTSLLWLVKAQNIPKQDYYELWVTFGVAYPKKTPKKRLIEGFPLRGNFDCDNAAKGLMDALEQSGVLENDSQIWKLHISKLRTVTDGYIKFALI